MANSNGEGDFISGIIPMFMMIMMMGVLTALIPTNAGAKTVVSLAITGSSSLVVGGSEQLTAVVTYSDDSTDDATSDSVWSSSNLMVATVSPFGLLTGVAAGVVTITATYSEVSATYQVTITAPAGSRIPIDIVWD